MSLILQALKRAEAERAIGQVPSVHATLSAEAAEIAPDARRRIGWWLGLAAILACVAAAGVWWIARDNLSGASPATPAAPAALATVAPPVPVPSPPPAAVEAMPAAPTSVVAASAVMPAVPPLPRRQAPPALADRPATPASAAVPVATPVRRLDELPAELRSALPALVVSGSIYSAQRSERMVIVNGEVHREGDVLAPDLLLERIEPKSMVLRFRGQAVRLPF